MKRELTKRELVLLAVLTAILLVLGYYKLLLQPIRSQIETYENMRAEETLLTETLMPSVTHLRQLSQELELVKAQGTVRPLPEFDNAKGVMDELHGILSAATSYALNFNSTVETGHIVSRPINLVYTARDYTQARAVINALDNGQFVSRITDLAYLTQGEDGVRVTLTVTFFELKND